VEPLDGGGWLFKGDLLTAEAAMKRILLFAFSITLVCAGVYALISVVLYPSVYGVARGGFAALVWLGLGGFLLWDDFLKPYAVRRQLPGE
jgi:hypothetical protein